MKDVLIENEKDGSVLTLVPAGEFIMGGKESYEGRRQDRIFLPDFYMSLYCVTNAQFARFVAESGYQAQGSWQQYAKGKDDHPVVAVTWFDAVAYCDWAGLRLPTEAEWEKAARGTDGRVYPWGDTWDVKRCQNYNNRGGYSDTCPVDGYPESCSVYGMYQMAGNVWEWCNSLYRDYPYKADDGREERGKNVAGDRARVLRGGSWHLVNEDNFRCALRNWDFPDFWFYIRGFRCACVREDSPLAFGL
jgi:formylglycine-generating enzyme required for sulfatase activity